MDNVGQLTEAEKRDVVRLVIANLTDDGEMADVTLTHALRNNLREANETAALMIHELAEGWGSAVVALAGGDRDAAAEFMRSSLSSRLPK